MSSFRAPALRVRTPESSDSRVLMCASRTSSLVPFGIPRSFCRSDCWGKSPVWHSPLLRSLSVLIDVFVFSYKLLLLFHWLRLLLAFVLLISLLALLLCRSASRCWRNRSSPPCSSIACTLFCGLFFARLSRLYLLLWPLRLSRRLYVVLVLYLLFALQIYLLMCFVHFGFSPYICSSLVATLPFTSTIRNPSSCTANWIAWVTYRPLSSSGTFALSNIALPNPAR